MSWLPKLFSGDDPDGSAAFRIRSTVPVDPAGFAAALFQSVATRMEPGHQIELADNGDVFDRLEPRSTRSAAAPSRRSSSRG